MKKFVRILAKAVKWIFIVFCIALIALFLRDYPVPRRVSVAIMQKLSAGGLSLSCRDMRFSLRSGLTVRRLKAVESEAREKTVFSADEIGIDLFARRVRIVRASYPRLPESYYLPGHAERNGRLDVEFPDLGRFELELKNPEILGLSPESLTASVAVAPERIDVSSIAIVWPEPGRTLRIDGFAAVDIAGQRVYGEVKGESRQSLIRPLIVALDEPVALPYMDAFAGVSEPVKAFCGWDVNLVNSDVKLKLDLHPVLGTYNGVPMDRADGEIGISVAVRGTNLIYTTRIGPIAAADREGGLLKGTVEIRGTNDTVTLGFDAASKLRFPQILDIIDYLNDGTLDCLKCDTPPDITVSGTLAPDASRQNENSLGGTVSFERGSFFGFKVGKASFGYSYIGDTVSFDRVSATSRDGGKISGSAKISVPGLDAERARFSVDVECENGTLSELTDAFGIDEGDKFGRVDAKMRLSSCMTTNLCAELEGEGEVKISNGHLAQTRLFMGLTALLAEHVPGVASIVNRSDASCRFSIARGVLKTEDLYVEGGLFSIKGWGTYDIAADRLDGTVRVQFLRNDSLLGKLVQPITWPFTKLLLEFKVGGGLEDPKWEYITLLDRVK